MPRESFDEFINSRQQTKSPATAPVDWDKRRKDWLEDIDKLYRQVEDAFRQYVSQGKMDVRFEPLTINEERLGSYETRKLIMSLGADVIEFRPIGAVIFGASGRVDVIGPSGQIKLVLIERDLTEVRLKVTILEGKPPEPRKPVSREELVWKIAGPPPLMELTDLTAETLQDLVMDLASV